MLARARGFGLIRTSIAMMLMHGDTIIATQGLAKDASEAEVGIVKSKLTDGVMEATNSLLGAEGSTPMPIELIDDFKPDCINKLAEGEPFFTLIGRDLLAAPTVRYWRDQVIEKCGETAKSTEAGALSLLMDNWHPRKLPD